MNANESVPAGIAQEHTGSGVQARAAPRRVLGCRPLSRFLAVTAATALAAGAALGTVLTAGPASAASNVGWIMGAGNVNGLNVLDPAMASYFFNTSAAYGTGSSLVGNPIQPGLATTPVLAYTSYAQFRSDIQNGLITFPYRWVMYDPEKWAQTPLSEQQDPTTYMTLFGQLAHAHGLKVIQAPAMDLAYVTGSVIPRKLHESAAAWWLRVNIAGAAAAAGDIVNIQDESLTANLSAYDWLFNNAAAQARAANPNIQVYSELSTANGTLGQMVATAQSVRPNGFYVAAPGAISEADQFFQQMKAAGY